MMQQLSKRILKLLVVGYGLAMSMTVSATLVHFVEADCSKLANPKTVLLVHATWCSHCKAFKPVYEKVSNEERYQDWTFYDVVADDLSEICGQWIDGYPYTYKDNMQTVLKGNRSQAVFEHFLDSKKISA